ncbi:tudor domain-containing protein 5 isoform X2 [Corythoichthys intestinalis]|uniref:tudor domain-containing protein 5 isoform X2 n=1 Tax=Corythoichthys intestinalis TaxID=161448 RepID=UPI0025A4DF3E|nr:tudor domain-containing protein 5 isoform X2 [Corythoichthys intestinalis]
MNQDTILAKLKKDVRSLLISSKVDLDPDQLRKDYRTMVGHPLPLKLLGFRNVMDMVQEMPDVVSVNFKEDGSILLKAVSHESTLNIEELVAKQRISTADKKRKDHQVYSSRYSHQSVPLVLPRRGGAPLALPPQLRAQLRLVLSQGPLRLSELETSFRRCFGHMLAVYDLGFYSIGEMLEAAKDLVMIQQGRFGSILTLREQMMPKPINLQQSHEAVTTTMKASVETTTKSQDSCGSSVTEQSTHVSSNMQLTDKNKEPEAQLCQESQLFQERFVKLQEEFRLKIVENGVAGTICHKLKERLQKVISQSSCEISVHNLPGEYKRVWGEDLPLKENGFVSVTELVDSMSDIFDLQQVEEDGIHDWIVKNVQDSVPLHSDPVAKQTGFHPTESLWESGLSDDGDIQSEDEDDEQLTVQHLVNQELMSELCPSISVYHGAVPLDALQSQCLERPTVHSAFELLPVRVEQVESLELFYISFIGNKEALTFENMKGEMRQCYSSPDVSERYRLPRQFIRRGQVCCTSSKEMLFSRGVIHKVISPTSVEVYHVDVGVVTTVHTDHLMFLKSCFSILPAQAVPSSLAGIKPNSGAWSSQALSSFVDLCSNRPLVAALLCYVGDVLQLYLCDTHTDEDIYIHRVLLSQGHGEACSDTGSTAVGAHISPVSVYLGEGTFDLPEVVEFQDDEMPALELIENNNTRYCQTPSPHAEEKPEFNGVESSTVFPLPVLKTHEKINDSIFQEANLKQETGLSKCSGGLLPPRPTG